MGLTNINTMTAPIPRTLIADDQPDVVTALRLLLRGAGFHTEGVSSPAAVLDAIRERDFDLVLMDLTTLGIHGRRKARPNHKHRTLDSTYRVVLTGWGSVELAWSDASRRA